MTESLTVTVRSFKIVPTLYFSRTNKIIPSSILLKSSEHLPFELFGDYMSHALLLFSSFLIDAFTALYKIPPCTACLNIPMPWRWAARTNHVQVFV